MNCIDFYVHICLSQAHSARKSPQKVVGVASHGSNSEPQNLQSFLKALGVEKGTSGKNLEEVIKMLSALQARCMAILVNL